MDTDKIIDIAKGFGFEVAVPMEPKTLNFLVEVRDMCASDKCRSYNRSWSCPPGCGTLEEIAEKCQPYKKGILVQTICNMEDGGFDYEIVTDSGFTHLDRFHAMTEQLNRDKIDFFAMGMGACQYCEECTYPDEPCRAPDFMSPSMEACGILVSEVCTDNNLKYYYGPNIVAYLSCFLFCQEQDK
jgi:predicted metal-binding protein